MKKLLINLPFVFLVATGWYYWCSTAGIPFQITLTGNLALGWYWARIISYLSKD